MQLSIVKRLQILENRFILRDRGIGKGVLVRDEEKMGIPCEIPTFTCFVFAVWLCFKSNERRGNRLYLIIFKPHWLLELCSLQSNEVKTKRLLNIIGNGINRLNCPIGLVVLTGYNSVSHRISSWQTQPILNKHALFL